MTFRARFWECIHVRKVLNYTKPACRLLSCKSSLPNDSCVVKSDDSYWCRIPGSLKVDNLFTKSVNGNLKSKCAGVWSYFRHKTSRSYCIIFMILSSTSKPLPNLFLRCWVEPKHLKIPPLTMIPILVDRASASSIECVVSTTALFLLCYDILETTVHKNLRALGSIPAEGSSRRTFGGFPSKASATESFRLFPPLKVFAVFYLWLVRFNSLSCLSTILSWRCFGTPLILA